MIAKSKSAGLAAVALLLGGCAGSGGSTSSNVLPSLAPSPSVSPTQQQGAIDRLLQQGNRAGPETLGRIQ